MRLHDEDKVMTFDILGYEFDDVEPSEDFKFDANWLKVKITYSSGDISKTYIDSCLLTTELSEICDRLTDVVVGIKKSYSSKFIEPGFSVFFAKPGEAVMIAMAYNDSKEGVTRQILEIMTKKEAADILRGLYALEKKFPKR